MWSSITRAERERAHHTNKPKPESAHHNHKPEPESVHHTHKPEPKSAQHTHKLNPESDHHTHQYCEAGPILSGSGSSYRLQAPAPDNKICVTQI